MVILNKLDTTSQNILSLIAKRLKRHTQMGSLVFLDHTSLTMAEKISHASQLKIQSYSSTYTSHFFIKRGLSWETCSTD